MSHAQCFHVDETVGELFCFCFCCCCGWWSRWRRTPVTIGGFWAVDGVALSTVEIWNAAQATSWEGLCKPNRTNN